MSNKNQTVSGLPYFSQLLFCSLPKFSALGFDVFGPQVKAVWYKANERIMSDLENQASKEFSSISLVLAAVGRLLLNSYISGS